MVTNWYNDNFEKTRDFVITRKFHSGGDPQMWVLTVFENNSYRMFVFENEKEAKLVLKEQPPAILSFTN